MIVDGAAIETESPGRGKILGGYARTAGAFLRAELNVVVTLVVIRADFAWALRKL